jgi:TPR repeat protein
VQQDDGEACKWFQLAAIQGAATAIKHLNMMQERNVIPTPPGAAIITILLTSPASSQYNSRSGIVVTPSSPIKPGKVCVLLDGETYALAFKVKNVQVIT